MYVILWKFAVRPENIHEFLAAYKSDGAWAALFAQAEGYLGTELLQQDASTFLTIDRWENPDDFAHFQSRFGDAYRALDAQLEGLTLAEKLLGTFLSAG